MVNRRSALEEWLGFGFYLFSKRTKHSAYGILCTICGKIIIIIHVQLKRKKGAIVANAHTHVTLRQFSTKGEAEIRSTHFHKEEKCREREKKNLFITVARKYDGFIFHRKTCVFQVATCAACVTLCETFVMMKRTDSMKPRCFLFFDSIRKCTKFVCAPHDVNCAFISVTFSWN